MLRRILSGCLLVGVVAMVALGQTSPILQPTAAGLSAAQLSTLQSFIVALEARLGDSSLGSQRRMGEGGWTQREFAVYTAGVLDSLGYETAVVTVLEPSGTERAWVLVKADLNGASTWVPVEPFAAETPFQQKLGAVQRIGYSQYSISYVTFDSVLSLAPNVPPVAVITPPPTFVGATVDAAWFSHRSKDPDGSIIHVQWIFGDDVQRLTTQNSIWYSFDSKAGGRDQVVTLTVTDNRGARGTAQHIVQVLTYQEWYDETNCECSH